MPKKSSIDPKNTTVMGPTKAGLDDTKRLTAGDSPPPPVNSHSPNPVYKPVAQSGIAGSPPTPHIPHTSTTSVNTSSYQGYGGTAYSYSRMTPTIAFKAHGIEFWGTAKDNLDDVELTDQDLIVNCTGTAYKTKPFVRESPKWLMLPDKVINSPQIVLDWNDFKPPPTHIEVEFWEELISQCRKNGIERVFCCCAAGQGRTGTALASLLLASGAKSDPTDAIEYIRDIYSEKAIESAGQMEYIYGLVWDMEEILENLRDDSKLKSATTSPPIGGNSLGRKKSSYWPDDDVTDERGCY